MTYMHAAATCTRPDVMLRGIETRGAPASHRLWKYLKHVSPASGYTNQSGCSLRGLLASSLPAADLGPLKPVPA